MRAVFIMFTVLLLGTACSNQNEIRRELYNHSVEILKEFSEHMDEKNIEERYRGIGNRELMNYQEVYAHLKYFSEATNMSNKEETLYSNLKDLMMYVNYYDIHSSNLNRLVMSDYYKKYKSQRKIVEALLK